jgi:hypothetical protein
MRKKLLILFTASLFVRWGDDSLIPIYEFITDPAKKAEIKEYVDNYLKENKAYLSE